MNVDSQAHASAGVSSKRMPDVALSEVELRALPSMLTVSQAASLLQISRSSAYKAVQSGEWPTRVVRVGRTVRIPTAEVLRLLGLAGGGSDGLDEASKAVLQPQDQLGVS